jgi:hypothetical protein
LRHVGLVFLIEDGGHGQHQVGIIIRFCVTLDEEVCVEELIVEVDNGRNVVVLVVVPRGAHVGKWPNRFRAAWEGSSLNPPCCGHQRVGGGGLGRRRGAVEGGVSF